MSAIRTIPYFALLDLQGNYTDHITGRKDEEKFHIH